jgi:hypothetical protein
VGVVEILRWWKGRLLQDLRVVVIVIFNIAMSDIAVAKRGLMLLFLFLAPRLWFPAISPSVLSMEIVLLEHNLFSLRFLRISQVEGGITL